MHIATYGKTRYWAVIDAAGTLVCLCVYQRGVTEVVRCLMAAIATLLDRYMRHAMPHLPHHHTTIDVDGLAGNIFCDGGT
jgi:hypothetical protein